MSQSCSLLSLVVASSMKLTLRLPPQGQDLSLNISLLLSLLPHLSVPLWAHRVVRAAELVHKAGALQELLGIPVSPLGAASCSGKGTLGNFFAMAASPPFLTRSPPPCPSLPSAHFFLICTFFVLGYLCFWCIFASS